MSHASLSRMLDELARDGRLESRGQFMTDPAAAWKKMGAFQMPFLGAWILKLAQAAEKAGCLLEVRQNRKRTQIVYEGWRVSREDVRSALLAPMVGCGAKALDDLGVGLRALAQTETLPFTAEYEGGNADLWDGHRFLPVPLGEIATQNGLRLTISHQQPGESSGIPVFLQRAPLERSARFARVLATHCCWRAAPIRLDGRTLSDYLLDPRFGIGSLHRPLLLLRAEEISSQPSLRLAPSGQVSLLRGTAAEGMDLSRLPSLAIALVTVFLSPGSRFLDFSVRPGKSPSFLCWVRDGVEVASETLPIPEGTVAIKVVCSAEGLATDVSGFRPRPGPELETRRKLVLEQILQRLWHAHDTDLPLDIRARAGNSVPGLLGAGMLLALEPVVGLLLLGLYGIGESDRRKFELEMTLAVERGLKDVRRSFEGILKKKR